MVTSRLTHGDSHALQLTPLAILRTLRRQMSYVPRRIKGLGRQVVAAIALIGIFSLTLGCQYVRPTMNAPLATWDPTYGYRSTNLPPSKTGSSDSLFIVASFSGGGTRASTLAYGVLRELARTQIVWEGQRKRLLDELNIINALSGGSFTAAYYALYGDRIFDDFETRFLRKNWESELRARIFRSPINWFRMWSPFFGRAHIFLNCWTKRCSRDTRSGISWHTPAANDIHSCLRHGQPLAI